MSRYESIKENLRDVQNRIESAAIESKRDMSELVLIAVTKNFPASDVAILKDLGVSNFGENRDAEGALKAASVPGTWHFQGQIQSNKLKSICSWADVIHSLDELRHFEIIEKVAVHPLNIFLQVNLDGAPNRGGASLDDLYVLARAVEESPKHNLFGLMAVAPLAEDPEGAFARLQTVHRKFLEKFPAARALSAGMSTDFEIAIKYGATHLRIGSQILGSRAAEG